MPRSRGNIDHLVVAPNGVWIVDAKRRVNGRVERRTVGHWRHREEKLFINGRDGSAALDGVQRQIDRVRESLIDTRFHGTAVRGALCFVDIRTGMFAQPFEIRGISITWQKNLVGRMIEPDVIADQERDALIRHLAQRFPPA